MDDHIFREYDIRGIVGDQLDEESVTLLGRAIGTFFRGKGASRISVGYDSRRSSTRFCEILTESLNLSGCDVILIGMVTTPLLYYTTFTKNVDGGVMITGSHNPPDHNGFKISLGTSTLYGDEIQEIRKIAASGMFSGGSGIVEKLDVLEDYVADIISKVSFGPRRIKAVIDAGNGMGGITAVPVYEGLGLELIKLFTDPDPLFPNHHPDPTVTENLQDVIEKVRETGADVGLAFDGDGDRIGVVDETGRIIWGDELMILFSRSVLEERPGSTIIAEVKCSQSLFDDIERNGGSAIMERAGHSIIKARMKRSGSVLAGEMSGHIFFADRFYGFDDATYAGARLLEILSKTDKKLSELFDTIPRSFSTPELRVDCPEEIKFEVVSKIASRFAKTNNVITIDGARIKFEHGWGLVRASNTQAILVMRFEAETQEELTRIRTTIESASYEAIAESKARLTTSA